MKHLESTLKQESYCQQRTIGSQSRTTTKYRQEKWSLDPDYIEEGPQGNKQKFANMICDTLRKKFESEKYLEEETFIQLIIELTASLPYTSSELQRLIRIQQTLQELGQAFFGELKNYVKHFQSLLDAKIRKLKKKEKKSELIEFERIAGGESRMKRKNPVSYINEDQPAKIKLKNREEGRRQQVSKKSFGTMNSGASNQNQSGSGKNKSGSDSKSGQANALAVLLANVTRPQDKRNEKAREIQKEKYDFSSVMSASVTVRQRNNTIKPNHKPQPEVQKSKEGQKECQIDEQKDDAFIFHRPKPAKRSKW